MGQTFVDVHLSVMPQRRFGHVRLVKGLERLKKDSLASYEQLTIGVEREKLLLKKVPLDASVHEDFSYQRQDLIANAIVLQYTVSTKVALQSTGNGDYLFSIPFLQVSLVMNQEL